MTESIVEIKNVGKRYHISQLHGRKNLQETVIDAMLQPFKRIRSLARTSLPTDADQIIWALKDISFDIHRGETFGLIGLNGSGKSTLLKIISHIVKPTVGTVTTWGRIGTLLEVGAGFNPELSGRENVYLKGTLHGMSIQEIDERYDAIVDFSEIPAFMDTPIKRYSSGMKIRLGFSIAAVMRPDIFIVDEAFAVGDAAFREKCIQEIEKMHRVGHTIIVVSHSPNHITRLCDRAAWLDKGELLKVGNAEDVTNDYLVATLRVQEERLKEERRREQSKRKAEHEAKKVAEAEPVSVAGAAVATVSAQGASNGTVPAEMVEAAPETKTEPEPAVKAEPEPSTTPEPEPEPVIEEDPIVRGYGLYQAPPDPSKTFTLRQVRLLDADGNEAERFDMSDSFRIEVEYDINQKAQGHLIVFISEYPSRHRVLCIGDADMDPKRQETRDPGSYRAHLDIPPHILNEGDYMLTVTLGIPRQEIYERHEGAVIFDITDEHSVRRSWYRDDKRPGAVGMDIPWVYDGSEPN